MADEDSHRMTSDPTSLTSTEQWRDEQQDTWREEQEQWQSSSVVNEPNGTHHDMEQIPRTSSSSIKRKSLPQPHPEVRIQEAPAMPVSLSPPALDIQHAESVEFNTASFDENAYFGETQHALSNNEAPGSTHVATSDFSSPKQSRHTSAQVRIMNETTESRTPSISYSGVEGENGDDQSQDQEVVESEGLHYHAFADDYKKHNHRISQMTTTSGQSSTSDGDRRVSQGLDVPRTVSGQRPPSTSSDPRGRTLSPLSAIDSDHDSQYASSRDRSRSRRSPARPISYVDLLNNVPHNQQVAPGGTLIKHTSLQGAVGSGASLLDLKKTIEMYSANIKKDTEPSVQYEFAILMINTARDATSDSGLNPAQLITEAKHILQRLADRAYPFAQYYLGDGYFSGLFNKEKPDYEKAFHLFVAASKHGHAEAAYRAALCYEFGWGTTKSYPKGVQFYRAASSKNHPGAATRLGLACLQGGMGLGREKYREGVKWLKRAQESADFQYNTAPYELGLLHLTGFGDDIFRDEAYASQLFTQSAELGHVEANFLMGQAYENGYYGCPKDAALSVHFYNGAAAKGHPEAMMALCAWYMVGAEPVLEKDEGEAYAWAFQSAEKGYVKAEYAVGYFTEMGIGCRRDPLEANVWYVRAADNGDQKAKQRLQIIRAAASGHPGVPEPLSKGDKKKKFMGIF